MDTDYLKEYGIKIISQKPGKKGIVVAVFKMGDINVCNYWGTALLSH